MYHISQNISRHLDLTKTRVCIHKEGIQSVNAYRTAFFQCITYLKNIKNTFHFLLNLFEIFRSKSYQKLYLTKLN